MKIKAAIISNGLEGLHYYYKSNKTISYSIIEITRDFNPYFSSFDLLIIPNGSDHIALYKIKNKIHQFLDEGKTLFCFDGWFTNWLPGSRWVMDNSKKTIDIRYKIKSDRRNLFKNVNIDGLIFSKGISGWWACGYIIPATDAEILLEDTWNRAIIILDETTTNGIIIATASGPLADITYQTTNDNNSMNDISILYKNLLEFIQNKIKQSINN
ncbi:MAG: hypothetical protein CVT95_02660 [Bacteroidetes bacterium HGW-Bacteroidetes-12]|jgi:hypothetical protein|nr:MAG: hypothetical protein CVT95_02660 [Bacteroidetes bacterium HGW-Bacteroidetes-12]